MMNSAVTRMYSFGENINTDVVLLLAYLLQKGGLRLTDDLVSYTQARISLNTKLPLHMLLVLPLRTISASLGENDCKVILRLSSNEINS